MSHAAVTVYRESKLSDALTRREMEYVKLVADGCSNFEVARRLGRSAKYVGTKMSLIYDKLSISKRGRSSHDPRITLARQYEREFGHLDR